MIRGAIFDADGTLLDSMGMWDAAGERYLASLGIRARPDLKEALFPLTPPQSAAYLKETYRLPLTEAEIQAGLDENVRRYYTGEAEAKPGARALLEALRARGVTCTLATATNRPLILAGLDRAGLLPLLDDVFTCGELGTDKSVPDIFHHARRAMGTDLTETWVFEDAVHAAETAFRAGFRVAGVSDPYSDQQALRLTCHLYLPSMADTDWICTQLDRL